MSEKTRPPPGNRNSLVVQGFSNSESEKRCRLGWPGEPAIKALYDDGRQCGGCSFYAPFDSDWGLCCHRTVRHFTETVFEHFACAGQVDEGWDAHSFSEVSSQRSDTPGVGRKMANARRRNR